MQKPARDHHYLPQTYLAGFTDTQAKSGRFFVLDRIENRTFRAKPRQVAFEKDFHRVDIPGKPVDIVEQALAQVDGKFANALRSLRIAEGFPNEENRNILMNLLALVFVKNPSTRRSINKFQERLRRMHATMLLSDKDLFEASVERARKAGSRIPEDFSYENAKRFDSEKLDITFSSQSNLAIEIESLDAVLEALDKRTWSLFIAPQTGPEFVSSDRPVTVWHRNPKYSGPIGLGLLNTEIFFPLSRTHGLFGIFENSFPPTVHVNAQCVAEMNARVVSKSERQVYSARASFIVYRDGALKEVFCSV